MPLPPAHELRCALPGGRQLTAATYGDPDGTTTVLYHHGTGGSRWEAAVLHDSAREASVRVVGVDRPGAGDSTPVPDRRMADWPADLLTLADHLGIDRFVAAGVSGGGPHAMAVAAAAPDRVIRCMPINSGPPTDDPDLLAQLPAKVRSGPLLARRAPWLFDKVLVTLLANQKVALRMVEKQIPSQDRFALDDPAYRQFIETTALEGRRNNPRFFAEALLLWAQDWPFDPYALAVPLTVVSGDVDPYRPFAEALAARNHDARLLTVPGGHFAFLRPAAARAIVTAVAGDGESDHPVSQPGAQT